jgi:hypothetical protein
VSTGKQLPRVRRIAVLSISRKDFLLALKIFKYFPCYLLPTQFMCTLHEDTYQQFSLKFQFETVISLCCLHLPLCQVICLKDIPTLRTNINIYCLSLEQFLGNLKLLC